MKLALIKNNIMTNSYQRSIATLIISQGIKILKDSSKDIRASHIYGAKINESIRKLGATNVMVDVGYKSTTWENWQEILKTTDQLIKNFKWTEDVFDCDNRAEFISSFIALTYNLNTCTRMYCRVESVSRKGWNGLHWCNLIIDKFGNTYLYDVDNHRQVQKITTNTPTIGDRKYNLINARVG